MKQATYKGSAGMELVFQETDFEDRTVRIYAKDALSEFKWFALLAMYIFGGIFAVPMVRHEVFYIAYWSLVAIITVRMLWKYYRPKRKSRKSGKQAAQ